MQRAAAGTETPTVVRWRSVLVTGVAVLSMAGPEAGSAADGLVEVRDGAVLGGAGLEPGSSETSVVTMSNPSREPAAMSLSVRVTSEDENGCLPAETRAAGEDCEADGGELGDWLEVAVVQDGVPVWSGPLTALETARRLPGRLAPGRSGEVELRIGLPLGATNEVMTDRLVFDLVVSATTETGDVGDAISAGVSAGGAGGAGVSAGGAQAGSGDAGTGAAVPGAVAAGGHGADRAAAPEQAWVGAGGARWLLLALAGGGVVAGAGALRSVRRGR
ncbi:hypothetical protein [Nocardioides dongkuii]|uniref:hypothetical protein n=1 Tax=Nocardioides dongkuii TaxID=2760089 RepID=UPI0015FA6152|nr:hypothetical protein [Nocardioides dongkuii]